ncbi:hypothetical protein THASP1DRAFT_32320, partial [Thamnocephalis sphaerospora]
MFKRWGSTKCNADDAHPPLLQTLTQPPAPSTTTSGKASMAVNDKLPAAPASQNSFGLSSWSLRGKNKCAVAAAAPADEAVSSSPPLPAVSAETSPPHVVASDAAGHLAGLVAAATAQPLNTPNNTHFTPRLLGTARRFGLSTVASVARFAVNLHQFSTHLRIIGPKDRRHLTQQAPSQTGQGAFPEDKEAGLGSGDSGVCLSPSEDELTATSSQSSSSSSSFTLAAALLPPLPTLDPILVAKVSLEEECMQAAMNEPIEEIVADKPASARKDIDDPLTQFTATMTAAFDDSRVASAAA